MGISFSNKSKIDLSDDYDGIPSTIIKSHLNDMNHELKYDSLERFVGFIPNEKIAPILRDTLNSMNSQLFVTVDDFITFFNIDDPDKAGQIMKTWSDSIDHSNNFLRWMRFSDIILIKMSGKINIVCHFNN